MNKIILISLIPILIFVFLYSRLESKNITETQNSDISLSSTEVKVSKKIIVPADDKKASLEINSAKYESAIKSQTNVYDFMQKLQNEGKINFKDKTYVGMGKFIEEINGVRSNGDKYWIYYVNGKKAEVGVSDYKLNPGDVVSWKYEKEVN